MNVIWNESLWFLQSGEGMIIGNDVSIKYKISGNSDYYHLCNKIKEKLHKNSMSLSELSEFLSNCLPPAVIKDLIANLINLGLIIELDANELKVEHPLKEYFSTLSGNLASAIKNFSSSKLLIIGHENLLNIFRVLSQDYNLENINFHAISNSFALSNELLNQYSISDMVVGVASNIIESLILFPALNKLAIENNKILLLGSIEGNNAHLGPLIIPGETACYHCMELRKENNLPNLSEYQLFKTKISSIVPNQVKLPDPVAKTFLCSSLFFDAVKFLSKSQMPATYQYTNIYNTERQKIESHYLVKVPLCNICGTHSTKPFSKIWCL